MTTARLSRPAPSIDLADQPLGAIASRDGSTAPTEAPCPAASATGPDGGRVGSEDLRLFCRCGGELRIVAVGGPHLRLGHCRNPKSAHHIPRLATSRRADETISPRRPGGAPHNHRRGDGRSTRSGPPNPSGA